jgi:hypothetical protein
LNFEGTFSFFKIIQILICELEPYVKKDVTEQIQYKTNYIYKSYKHVNAVSTGTANHVKICGFMIGIHVLKRERQLHL